mgnify:CR=1 FL=1
MVHVLLVANDSLLADGIESVLSQEADLSLFRLRHIKPEEVESAVRNHQPEVIIVEEGASDDEIITVSNLVRQFARSLIITISTKQKQIHICNRYKVRTSGLAELVHLIKTFRRQP